MKRVVDSGKKKVDRLHSIINNRDVNLSSSRLLLLSVVSPTRVKCARHIRIRQQHLNQVCWAGKAYSLVLFEHFNEAIRGDMGLDTLQGCRDKAKLKLWHKLEVSFKDRYLRRVFTQVLETC